MNAPERTRPPAIPTATYRLQLSGAFPFARAAALSGYLRALGISHCYASPILGSRHGSPHGYDGVDPTVAARHDERVPGRRPAHAHGSRERVAAERSAREDVGFDKSTTEEAHAMLLRRASVLLPALCDMPVIKHWAGLRPGSPGNIPTVGRHPQLDNLYINGGHFRYGVTMAPASVEVLLNTMNETPQPFDVSPYLWR